MRAIIIDPQTQNVTEIDHSGDFRDIYKLICNDCGNFAAPIVLPNGDTFYCDAEGLYHENIGGIIYPDWSYPIVGRILVLGSDYETGDSVSAESSVEDIKKDIRFLKYDEFILTNWFAQYQ